MITVSMVSRGFPRPSPGPSLVGCVCVKHIFFAFLVFRCCRVAKAVLAAVLSLTVCNPLSRNLPCFTFPAVDDSINFAKKIL